MCHPGWKRTPPSAMVTRPVDVAGIDTVTYDL